MIKLYLLLQRFCNLIDKRMKIKRGDTVKVLYGKDSGKQGKVVVVNTKTNSVVVEGINIFKKHVKGDGRTRTSEILNITKPMSVSKVMIVCNSCGKTTRIGVKRVDGKVVRVCKKCGKSIDTVKESIKKEDEKETKKKVEKKTTKNNKKTTKKK